MGNVQTLQFDCYDGTQWQTTWDTSAGNTNLPVAVRIRIQLVAKPGEAAGNLQPLETIVPLVTQTRTNSTTAHRRDAMRARANHKSLRGARRGSVLIIVLWIAFGLVSLALYFANSMNFELRASDNRVCAQAADQAIEGAARYINYLLTQQIANGSNGVFLVLDDSLCKAVPVGEAHYWLIGRDTNTPVGPGRMCFGLVDEASKLNLNMAASTPLVASNQLIWLPRMTVDLTQAILDWVNTNGTGPTVSYYAMQQPSYQCKCEPFETVDELRLLYGADMDTLVGEDANRNGILDPNENDDNQNGMLDPGILEYVTVYSREPSTNRGQRRHA